MPNDKEPSHDANNEMLPAKKSVSDAARRALAEAEARRAAAGEGNSPAPNEFQGPKGPEPTRFGDWERKGIASDF